MKNEHSLPKRRNFSTGAPQATRLGPNIARGDVGRIITPSSAGRISPSWVPPAAEKQNGGVARPDDTTATIPPLPPIPPRHMPTTQITGSLKAFTTPGTTNSAEKRFALAALVVACIAVFFTALDQTVVVTALPQIIIDLQVPLTQIDHAAWIISAYLLGFVVVMPLMGRVSDIYGRRRIFFLCLAIFGIGSIMCGLAPLLGRWYDLRLLSGLGIDTSSPGLDWLIGARLFQAVGGGAIVPVAMAIAGDFYGQDRRGLALGIVGAVTEAGGVLGPLYGALIVAHLGWQYIFYFNVPVVIGLVIATWLFIPRGKRLHEGIDWAGATLLGLSLICLSLGLAQQGTGLGPSTGATAKNNPIVLGMAVLFLIAFILLEREARWPVVQLSLFKRVAFSGTSLVSLLVGGALIIAMADIPIFVDTVLRLPVLDSGLALLRLTAMIPVGALLGGWLCNRITCRITGIIGLLFTALGFFLMSRWPAYADWTQITISTMIAGFGFGLVIAPIATTAINAVKETQAGMSTAIVTALRMVGMTLGLAALTSWALAQFNALVIKASLPPAMTFDQFIVWEKGYVQRVILSAHMVYTSVFFAAMGLCLVALVPAFFLWGKKAVVAETEAPTTFRASSTAAIEKTPTAPLALSSSTAGRVHGKAKLRQRLIVLASLLVLVGGGLFGAWLSPKGATASAAGLRTVQLALNNGALNSVFQAQLQHQNALTDLNVIPLANDGLALNLNLHIDANGIHRIMPVELDGTMGLDQKQNLQLHVQHLNRDGIDAGATAATNMQAAVNQLLLSVVMPALRTQLKGIPIISVHTSAAIACGKGTAMLVLQIKAPPIPVIVTQQVTNFALCFTGPIDLNKLQLQQ